MKSIITIVIALFGTLAFAQTEQALAHYNQVDILESLPERDSLEQVLQQYTMKLEQSYQKMVGEYEQKLQEFQEGAEDRPDAITEIMQNEIAEMQQRIQAFPQTAQQDILKRQETIFLPLQEKVMTAVKTVAAEKGVKYVFDISVGNPIVIDESLDITTAIKTKLGI